MAEEDIHRILDEKVYDSQRIGISGENAQQVRENKGSGFGLMNCKGIIDKYRKTNSLFEVCAFGIESEVGKGSRIYFRLPKGLRRVVSVWLLLLGCFFSSCSAPVEGVSRADVEVAETDSVYEELLDVASVFADEAYFANLEFDHDYAIECVDSALFYLNAHHAQYGKNPADSVVLVGVGQPAELSWWKNNFTTDYHVILDIRNEAAVAFLALKQWEAYNYNNKVYTSLYKLQSEDWSLEEYCRQLKHSTTNKMVGIALCLLLLAALLVGYYWVYVRRRIANRVRLEQVFDINQAIFDVTAAPNVREEEEALQKEEETLRMLPRRIVEGVFEPFNELFPIDKLDLTIYNSVYGGLLFSETGIADFSREKIVACFEEGKWMMEGNMCYIPLVVETESMNQKVGVLAFRSKEEIHKQEALLLELVVRYIAVLVLNSVLKTANQYRDIESAHEEVHKVMWEDNQIHVQNMVLDNCLSSIKHETVYYPNRIRQIVARLRDGKLDEQEELNQLEAVSELVEYYKGVFTILSSCASRQLEEVTFRRSVIPVADLLEFGKKYIARAAKKHSLALDLEISALEGGVVGDRVQLEFLIESLINEACAFPKDGKITFKTYREDGFVYFYFLDHRRTLSDEEVSNLFYPDLRRMEAEERGERSGSVYLICKQIIREHDEFAGRRGCRIEGRNETDGFGVLFSVPAR